MFLFGPYGEPLRDGEAIRDKAISTPFDYRVVPEKQIGNPGLYQPSYQIAEIGEGLDRKKIALIEGQVLVADTVPDRFKPIIGVHERGHHYGLSHQEMFALEMGMADKLSIITGDRTLKEDYLRWGNKSSGRLVNGNLGKERQMNTDQMTDYAKLKNETGVDGVYTIENDTLVELF